MNSRVQSACGLPSTSTCALASALTGPESCGGCIIEIGSDRSYLEHYRKARKSLDELATEGALASIDDDLEKPLPVPPTLSPLAAAPR